MAALTLLTGSGAEAAEFRDDAGRLLTVPDRIQRVFAAGPPAAIQLYTLAPDRLLGWNRGLTEEERRYIAREYRDLPVVGRPTGRGGSSNTERVLQAGADIVIDYGSIKPTFRSLADRVQVQTRLPYALFDGGFDKIPRTYRRLGRLLGVARRGEELARYAEALLERTKRVTGTRRGQEPRVYYARGPLYAPPP